MAGNYVDVPGPRMPYDRDGTLGFNINNSNVVSLYSTGQLQTLNNESTDSVDPSGSGYYHGFLFPELRDVVGMFLTGWYRQNFSTAPPDSFGTSTDTTNGFDGTWTSRTAVSPPGLAAPVIPYYRSSIVAVSWPGIKALRFRWYGGGGGDSGAQIYAVHLYGKPSSGEAPDRLRFCHPTLDQEVDGAYFDWGNAPRNSNADKTFRIKNNSSTLTANTITVGREALTDTSPTNISQHTFSNGGAFASTTSISSLAPGAISSVLTVRRSIPANASLSLWALRAYATAATWS